MRQRPNQWQHVSKASAWANPCCLFKNPPFFFFYFIIIAISPNLNACFSSCTTKSVYIIEASQGSGAAISSQFTWLKHFFFQRFDTTAIYLGQKVASIDMYLNGMMGSLNCILTKLWTDFSDFEIVFNLVVYFCVIGLIRFNNSLNLGIRRVLVVLKPSSTSPWRHSPWHSSTCFPLILMSHIQ